MTNMGTPPAGEQGGFPDEGDEHPSFDTSVAHLARVYNYWLGGKDNYAADRAAGDEIIQVQPEVVDSVRAGREFLARVVRYLTRVGGIRQFLDIGTGIPSANNTHEVAQDVAPESRIVYVDNDPIVLAHARALLTSTPEGATDYIDADLRDTQTILDQARHSLDFSRPVAVMLIAVMHVIDDDDDPYGIVTRFMDAAPTGSYLALSHVVSDIEPEKMEEVRGRLNRVMFQHSTYRSHAEVTRFFDGLELVEPGVVRVQEWWPDSELEAKRTSRLWGGVGRKN
jgi:S-adenosyl methyltransferase